MAATRLIALHVNKGKSIAGCLSERLDYAENPLKTQQGERISSYECDQRTAAQEFLLSKRDYEQKTGSEYRGNIIAYQIRQSFKPGEITPEDANKLGYETAMRFTKGKHAFIVSTHTDKAHIHNHIIFNSTTLDSTRKFKNLFLSGLALQRLSDIVCFEHGYSIIEKKPYAERQKRTVYPKRHTIRSELQAELDELIRRKPKDLEDLLRMLEQEGYEIKRGKHVAVKGRAQKRFIRLDSLQEGYSPDALQERIAGANARTAAPARRKPEMDLLIDIQAKALGKGAGYARWAKKYNLKQTAKTLLFLQEHNIHSYEELEQHAREATERADELLASIRSADARIKEIDALKRHIFTYSKTSEIYKQYKSLPKEKRQAFYEAHRSDIDLHEAAKEAFEALPGKKIPKIKELNKEQKQLILQRQKQYGDYKAMRREKSEWIKAEHNARQILKTDQSLSPEIEKTK